MSYPQLLTPEEKLADAKERLAIPRVVVICGSTRFMQEMADADCRLTWEGFVVVRPGCDMKNPHPLWADPDKAEAGKQRLDALHRAKIRLADEVLVVGSYIGDSTRAEIAYARSLGKPVEFTHPSVEPPPPPPPPAPPPVGHRTHPRLTRHNTKETRMNRRLKGQTKPLGIVYEPITRLWFWDCRVCPGFPVVGHASTHGTALNQALFHAKNASAHQPTA